MLCYVIMLYMYLTDLEGLRWNLPRVPYSHRVDIHQATVPLESPCTATPSYHVLGAKGMRQLQVKRLASKSNCRPTSDYTIVGLVTRESEMHLEGRYKVRKRNERKQEEWKEEEVKEGRKNGEKKWRMEEWKGELEEGRMEGKLEDSEMEEV